MSHVVEASVSSFNDDIIVLMVTIECENPLDREIERQRLEAWITQLAKSENAPYETIRRTKTGEVIYGDLE